MMRTKTGPLFQLGLLFLLASCAHSTSPRTDRNPAFIESWDYKRVANPGQVNTLDQENFRFALSPSTPKINDGTRNEITHPLKIKNGELVTFGMKTKADPFREGQPESYVIAQWHESMKEGLGFRRPPLVHRMRKGVLNVMAWSDEIFERHGMKGDGEVVAQLVIDPRTTYDFRYAIQFDPEKGYVVGYYRRCLNPKICEGSWTKFVDFHGGLGYRDSEYYYFKFGLYTTQPFREPIFADHSMNLRDLEVVDESTWRGKMPVEESLPHGK